MSYKKTRKSSSIINIRIFHNWIKRELISQTVNYLSDNYNINSPKLLDLAVGKGGDLLKWYDSNIFYVVGLDLDQSSLFGPDGAESRYKKLLSEIKSGPKPDYKFYQFDLSQLDNIPKIQKILNNTKFNIISCQFAIHYFFKNPESLDNFVQLVSQNISKNGFFIGTTMDGKQITNLLKSKNTRKIKTDLYQLDADFDPTNTSNYGDKYKILLGNKSETGYYFSGHASEEYLVNLDILKSVCEKYGLLFLDIITFRDWYSIYKEEFPDFYKYKLSNLEQEFSFLNFSFVFYMP